MQVFPSRREDGSLSTRARFPLDVSKPRSRREGLPYAEHFRTLCRTLQNPLPNFANTAVEENTYLLQRLLPENKQYINISIKLYNLLFQNFLSDYKSKLLLQYSKIYSKVFFNILIYRGIFFNICQNILLFFN